PFADDTPRVLYFVATDDEGDDDIASGAPCEDGQVKVGPGRAQGTARVDMRLMCENRSDCAQCDCPGAVGCDSFDLFCKDYADEQAFDLSAGISTLHFDLFAVTAPDAGVPDAADPDAGAEDASVDAMPDAG